MKPTSLCRTARVDRRVLLAVLVVLFFPVLLLEFGTTAMLQREVERVIVHSSLQLGGQLSLALRSALGESLAYLERTAAGSDLRNLNRNLAGDLLALARERRPEFEQLLLVDADGALVADAGFGDEGRHILETDFPGTRLDEVSPRQGKVFCGRVSRHLYPVWPVRDAAENLVGFLIARIRARVVRGWLEGRSLGTGEQVYLFTRAMELVYGPGELPAESLTRLASLAWGAFEWRREPTQLVTVLPVVGHELKLLIIRDAREAFGLVRELRGQLLLTVVFGVLLAFTLGWYAGRRETPDPVEGGDSPPPGDAALPAPGGFDLLARTIPAAAPAQSVDEFLQSLLHGIIEHFQLERASVMLMDEETDELLLRAVRIFDRQSGGQMEADFVRRIRLFQGDGVAGQVAREGRGMLLSSGARDERFKGYDPETGLNETIRCLITVPLKDGERVIGVLNAVNPQNGDSCGEAALEQLTRLGELAGRLVEQRFRLEVLLFDRDSGLYSEAWLRRHLQRERAAARRSAQAFNLLLVRIDEGNMPDDVGELSIASLRRDVFLTLCQELGGLPAGRYREPDQCLVVLPPAIADAWPKRLAELCRTMAEREFSCGEVRLQRTLSMAYVSTTDPLDRLAGLLRGLELALENCRAAGGNCLRLSGMESVG